MIVRKQHWKAGHLKCVPRRSIKNALLLSVGHFPIAVLMSAINLFPLLLLSFFPDVFLRISMLWILFGFALIAKINTKMILKVFKPFLQAADAEDTEIADELIKCLITQSMERRMR